MSRTTRWYKRFKETGSCQKQNITGQPRKLHPLPAFPTTPFPSLLGLVLSRRDRVGKTQEAARQGQGARPCLKRISIGTTRVPDASSALPHKKTKTLPNKICLTKAASLSLVLNPIQVVVFGEVLDPTNLGLSFP